MSASPGSVHPTVPAHGVNWSRAIDGGGVVVGDDVKVTLELALVEQQS